MYGSIELIKYRLRITSTVTTYNAEMTIALEEASDIIDTKLEYYTSIPLASTADILGYAAADYGASIFRSRQIPSTIRLIDNALSSDELWSAGDRKLDWYIKSYYMGNTFTFIKASTTTTSDYEVIS